jgi:hypothetical protein
MRLRLLALALALCALAVVAAPAGAQSRPTIGISENSPTMFGNPLFQQLGARHARVVVSYDFLARGDDEVARVDTYLRQAQATNTQVLVAFEHSRGDASRCNQRRFRTQRQCRLPSTQAYTRAVQAFFQRFGGLVRAFSPWNEVNHFTQPTWRNPRRAAQFSNIARRFCRGTCQLVAADFLDQAKSVVSRNPDYRETVTYIRRFRRSLRVPRSICGLHNYSDTNRFRDSGTRTLIRAMGCRQIWLTETGGLYRFGRSFPASQSRQLRATRYLFNTLVRRNRRIRRVYIYTFFGNVTPRFDAGLVVNTRARSAYREVQRRLRR